MRKFRRARAVMKRVLKKDEELRRIYIDNIAMCLYDTGEKLFENREVRNKIAGRILSMLFGR